MGVQSQVHKDVFDLPLLRVRRDELLIASAVRAVLGSGSVPYDKADGTGTVEIVTELASWARGKDFFDLK